MARTVVALFPDYKTAEDAAWQIKERGLRTDDISIVAKDSNNTGSNLDSGMKTGATMGTQTTNDNISDGVVTGGILGGVAGILLGAGSLMIPGLGIVAAAGPIAGLISGAVTGGIVGGLMDLGIPEERSRQYESDIKAGRVLFSMRTDDDKVDQISSILKTNGASKVDTY